MTVLAGAALISILSYMVVVLPVAAFSVGSSATGYVTRASASSVSALQAANLVAEANAIAGAAFAAGGTSLAIDLVAAATGWPALGVVAGLGLVAMYYSSSDLAAVKAAAATPGAWSVPGLSGLSMPIVQARTANGGQYIYFCDSAVSGACTNVSGSLTAASADGWTCPVSVSNSSPVVSGTWLACFKATSTGGPFAAQGSPTPATQAQIASYVQGAPSTDPNSIPAHQTLQGWGSSPQAADQTTTISVTPSQLATTTVPAATVAGTDLVLNPNATPPAGPAPSVSPTQLNTNTSVTTSTTTTTGGVTTTTATTTSTDSPTVSACSVGNHDQRTFGGVLQQHMSLWQGSGLYSALNLLKTLAWPTAFQTYTLTSSTWGTFTIDFSAYSTVVAALRTIIIALASFVAYRIVFVGGR